MKRVFFCGKCVFLCCIFLSIHNIEATQSSSVHLESKSQEGDNSIVQKVQPDLKQNNRQQKKEKNTAKQQNDNKDTTFNPKTSKEVMNELIRRLARFDAMYAQFKQYVISGEPKFKSNSKIEEGEVWFNKKGGFRWHIRKPYDQIVISDGEKVWVIEKDFKQVIIRMQKSTLSDTISGLLTESNTRLFLEKYFLRYTRKNEEDKFTLIASHGMDSVFENLDLIFVKDNLVAVDFKDITGMHNRIDFNNVKIGTERALKFNTKELFTGFIPKGFDVVDETTTY